MPEESLVLILCHTYIRIVDVVCDQLSNEISYVIHRTFSKYKLCMFLSMLHFSNRMTLFSIRLLRQPTFTLVSSAEL